MVTAAASLLSRRRSRGEDCRVTNFPIRILLIAFNVKVQKTNNCSNKINQFISIYLCMCSTSLTARNCSSSPRAQVCETVIIQLENCAFSSWV